MIYERTFANALRASEIEELRFRIKQDAQRKLGQSTAFFDYITFRISYDIEIAFDLIFIYITGLNDDFFRRIRTEMSNFKKEFLQIFQDKMVLDQEKLKQLDPIIDAMHKNLKPKIAVVGWSGVGKTTIKTLIKMDEIPLQHIPTISCDIATIEVGKLQFQLFDFAGQEQFSYLWKGFIKGSDAVLIVTDSTPANVEKSKFFMKLRDDEAASAYAAIIGNKQDLDGAMPVEEIEALCGMKTYPMVANKSENRSNMVNIIAQVLDMNVYENPLLLEQAIEERKAKQHASPKIEKASFGSISNLMKSLGKEEAPNTEASKPVDPNINETIVRKKIDKDTEFRIAKEIIRNEGITEQELLSFKLKDKNKKIVSLSLDACLEVMKELNKVDIHDKLRKHFDMIQPTIKAISGDITYTFEEFLKNFEEYCALDSFSCKAFSIKQFIESQLMLLESQVDKKQIESLRASKKIENATLVMNAMNLAFLTVTNPEKYKDFNTIVNSFSKDSFKQEELSTLKDYYQRILNKLSSK